MEFEKPILEKMQNDPVKVADHASCNNNKKINSSMRRNPLDSNDLNHGSESFRMLRMDVERSDAAETKFAWLRSQLIGKDVEFETPFGKRQLTYADHTASGRGLHYIENYIINDVLPFYGNTHTSDSFVGERTTKMVHEATEYIKRCLGGGEDDALLFCGSGTTASIKRLQEVMGIAVPSCMRERMVKSLSSEERWVVFVGPYEHHSNLLSWRQSLAEVIEIGIKDDGLTDMETLRFQLESFKSSNRPMLGSFSACSNVTGVYTETRAIAQLLHQNGAFACFDFAASAPYVEIDMRSGELDGYDAIFLSPHKFLGGPGTPGILLMSKALYQLRFSPPSTCGGGTVSFVNGFSERDTLYYDDIEEREDAGTPPIIQKIRAALAFWVKQYIGYSVIEAQEHIYINTALRRLLSNPNIWVLGNTSTKRLAILSFLVFTTSNASSDETSKIGERGLYMWRESGNKKDKPLHGPFNAKLLNDLFGIQARGGCACAGPYGHHLLGVQEPLSLAFRSAIQKGYNGIKPGWARVSFPYYMSMEEFEFILAALEFIAMYGQRFLPLYHFNWKTGTWSFRKTAFMENLNGKKKPELDVGYSSFSDANLTSRVNSDESSEIHEDNVDNKDVGVIRKYASYLKTAKHIADSLPKFPPQRRVPKYINPSLVHFRV
ncbi:PREDICTED: uncharacterized protein LOC104596772 [Nelumbo nucifera]|uniref:Aminotransferase class V domain-containing protein n=2 Tax=Nelumbo nucifera TaxID=4432 RepID=A0A822Z6D9_NELNU|nr:PREDICTED: uncharacterized protein LOC104596772 [Nelumbo nucifera]DAD39241.1 TPA_asm: hypothetical protein HUJ06_013564 [Nelumbo nucifera]